MEHMDAYISVLKVCTQKGKQQSISTYVILKKEN